MLTVYTKNNCAACDRLKAKLKQKNIEFEIKNIDLDLDSMDFLVKHHHRTVPVVYDGDKFVNQATL
jgi:glutaredoxin